MAITVVLRGEDRSELAMLRGPYEPLIEWSARFDYPTLGYVDRYGDTVFNRGQMYAVLEELDKIELTFPEVADRHRHTIETGLDPTAIWEWGVVERVSTGLLLTQIGVQPVGSQMLAAADRIAQDYSG